MDLHGQSVAGIQSLVGSGGRWQAGGSRLRRTFIAEPSSGSPAPMPVLRAKCISHVNSRMISCGAFERTEPTITCANAARGLIDHGNTIKQFGTARLQQRRLIVGRRRGLKLVVADLAGIIEVEQLENLVRSVLRVARACGCDEGVGERNGMREMSHASTRKRSNSTPNAGAPHLEAKELHGFAPFDLIESAARRQIKLGERLLETHSEHLLTKAQRKDEEFGSDHVSVVIEIARVEYHAQLIIASTLAH